jgi:26S proteasome regulatory subunit N3
MPERRNLRSSKDSTSSEKSRADSSKSSSKDKPVPSRSTSSKAKPTTTKRGSKDLSNDKPKINGAAPQENGIKASEDVEMANDGSDKKRSLKEGDDEMTVIVPPPKSSKTSAEPEKDREGDVAMDEEEEESAANSTEPKVDPKVKTIAGMLTNSKLRTFFFFFLTCI